MIDQLWHDTRHALLAARLAGVEVGATCTALVALARRRWQRVKERRAAPSATYTASRDERGNLTGWHRHDA